MLTAQPVTPTELRQAGFIHVVAPDLESLHILLEKTLAQIKLCAPLASAQCKGLILKGWKFPGSVEQEAAIRVVYDQMVGPSPEARCGISKFQEGFKDVDWAKVETLEMDHVRSKI